MREQPILRPINNRPLPLRPECIYGRSDKSCNDIVWALPIMEYGDYFFLQGKYCSLSPNVLVCL